MVVALWLLRVSIGIRVAVTVSVAIAVAISISIAVSVAVRAFRNTKAVEAVLPDWALITRRAGSPLRLVVACNQHHEQRREHNPQKPLGHRSFLSFHALLWYQACASHAWRIDAAHGRKPSLTGPSRPKRSAT
jgi:hypothetical protein